MVVFILGMGHTMADTPTVPAPPPAIPAFNATSYMSDCQQLVEDWNRLEELRTELGG